MSSLLYYNSLSTPYFLKKSPNFKPNFAYFLFNLQMKDERVCLVEVMINGWFNTSLGLGRKQSFIYNSKQQLTMQGQCDYEEAAMSEMIPIINIPMLVVTSASVHQSFHGNSNMLIDLQKLIEEEKASEQKRIQALKQKQHHIGEQVGRRLAQKERKIRQLQQVQKRKMYSQCTFKPKTTQKGQKRSLQQFLNQQQQFTKKVAQKRNNLKNNLQTKQNTNTFHPKINNNKNKGQEKSNQTTVFQRLYALKDKQNTEDNHQDTVGQFQPTITDKSKKLTRNTPIDNLLYNDALRRQQKAREIESIHGAPQSKPERQLNLNNEKYVAQKFIKEYFNVIEKLSVPSSSQNKIEYVLFNQILKEMGFVGIEEQGQNNYERTLIHQAYQTLEKYQVNAKNICVFLLAIIGVYHINPINFQQGDTSTPQQEFALDEPEGRKLQKYFDLFKRNRLFGQVARKQNEKEHRQVFTHSFHPKINKCSEELAQRYRQQMLEEVNQLLQNYPELEYSVPADGIISHTDLLILNNLAREIKQQQKKEDNNKKKLEECTFKPATLPSSMQSSKVSNSEFGLGQKKSIQLYNYHKNLQNKKESLRMSRQNQDVQLKQCTFAPSINHNKVSTDTKNYHTKQVEESLYRMKKGRQERQQKKKFLERGEKVPRKDQFFSVKEKPRVQEQLTPTLLLDVNLGQKMDRITLYPGDENRLQQIAQQFSIRHGLDSENTKKLCQLLKIQLQSVLMKIDEDEQSENQIQ